jgi:glycosyltransferase involved in cell wall biosynthesis
VIANDPIAAFMGRIISRIAGVEKVVYYCHGLPFASHSNLFEKVAYLSLEIFASFFTKYNIVMNNYDYSILKSLNRNTFFNHGVGVDPATIQKKMSNENKNDKKNIIFIARLVKKKGIYEYIDIARNSEGPKYNFYIYGDGNIKIKNRIQQLISKEKNIFYSGYKNNINEAFNNADIFLFPSRYTEGLPRVIMESMIFGVPVIASNIRGNKDIIINGYNGFLFKFKHDYIKNIYSIIETLNSNDAERDRIIENAKKTIYDKYTIIKIMDEYRYIIHKIEQN